jgi:RNA polymerase primary sigma factor
MDENAAAWKIALTDRPALKMVDQMARRLDRASSGRSCAGYEDIYQAGMLGLLEAAKRYDPAKGASFATYARYWVRQKVVTLLRSLAPMKLNSRVTDTMRRISQLKRGEDRPLTPEEVLLLASSQRSSIRLVYYIEQIDAWRMLRIAYGGGGPDNNIASLLSDESQPDEDDLVALLDAGSTDRRVDAVKRAMADLEAGSVRRGRDMEVLRLRYGIGRDDPCTFAVIGGALGVSRQRAKQLHDRAIKQLLAAYPRFLASASPLRRAPARLPSFLPSASK